MLFISYVVQKWQCVYWIFSDLKIQSLVSSRALESCATRHNELVSGFAQCIVTVVDYCQAQATSRYIRSPVGHCKLRVPTTLEQERTSTTTSINTGACQQLRVGGVGAAAHLSC